MPGDGQKPAFVLPSLIKNLSTRNLDAETEEKNRRILETFSQPYHLVSLPNLEDAFKRVNIADLDKYLTKSKKLPAFEDVAKFYKPRSDSKMVNERVPTPPPPEPPVSPVVRSTWNIEDTLKADELRLMPAITPRVKLEGTFLDALEAYKNTLKHYGLPPADPIPIFGQIVEITNCDLSSPHCQAICDAIAAGPTMTKLSLRQNRICDTGVALLVTSAFQHPLETFECDDAALGKMTMKAFNQVSTSLLIELAVTNAGIGGELGTWEDGAPEEADAATVKSSLKPSPMPGASPALSEHDSQSSASGEDMGGEYMLASSSDSDADTPVAASPVNMFDWRSDDGDEVTGLIGKPIFEVVASALMLSRLDLSNNAFCDEAWRELTHSLLRASELTSLKLDWCSLTASAVKPLCTALRKLGNLQMLSLRSSVQLYEDSDAALLLSAIEEHRRLAHVDLRDNMAWPVGSLTDVLQNGLFLLCVHFDWNPDLPHIQALAQELEWKYDEYGHVVAWRALHIKGMHNWLLAADTMEEGVFIEGCWICQKCVGHDITWSTPESGDVQTPFVNLIASWVRWKPTWLPRAKVTATSMPFSKIELVPPGKENYFFFESKMGFMCAANLPSMPTPPAIKDLFAARGVVVPTRLNYVEPKPFVIPEESVEGDEALKKYGSPLFSKLMRKGPKTQESIFRTNLLKDCFDRDLQTMDFTQLCDTKEEVKVKRRIWTRYYVIYDLFMMYQGRGDAKHGSVEMRVTDLWAFIDELKKTYKASMSMRFALVDFEELVALVSRRSNGMTFTRPKFWEVLLRLGVQVYPDKSVADAFSAFVDHYVPCVQTGPLAPFTRNLMYLPEVHGLFFDWRETVKRAYDLFCTSPNTFVTLTQTLRLYDKSFNTRHCSSIFALSKVASPGKRQRMKLAMPEFQEALARLVPVKTFTTKLSKEKRSQTRALRRSLSPHRESIDTWHSSRPVSPRDSGLRGIERLREVVHRVMERDPKEINLSRERNFVTRLESLLRLLDEKLKDKTIRQKE